MSIIYSVRACGKVFFEILKGRSMLVLLGLIVIGASGCSSRPIKPDDHVCIYSKDMGRYGDMTFEQKIQLPMWVKACN